MSRKNGADEAKLAALPHYHSSPQFDEHERLALAYADGMSTTPVSVDNALFDRLREHFSEAQLVELSSTVAWENYRARFNRGLDVPSDDFSEGAVCPLPARLPAPGRAA